MVKINCKIPPVFLKGMIEVLELYIPSMMNMPSDRGDLDWMDGDEEMPVIWVGGLREALRADCASLLQLVRLPKFGKGICQVEEEQVEPLLRSISAVRLFIRRTALAEIPDEDLEKGDLAGHLVPEERRFYLAVYIFLAGLQELLLQQLS